MTSSDGYEKKGGLIIGRFGQIGMTGTVLIVLGIGFLLVPYLYFGLRNNPGAGRNFN